MRVLPLSVADARRPVAVPRHDPREAVARALSRCVERERVLLALILFERLTPAEAARALDVPAARIERAYAALLAELRRSLGECGLRPRDHSRSSGRSEGRVPSPRPVTPTAPLRRAS